jgi:Outer membrane protein beta-barrel domain
MNARIRHFLTGLMLVGAPLVLTAPAAAQEGRGLPAPIVEFSAGTFIFPDDSVVREGFLGAGARVYLGPRISVGPEVAYIVGNNHSHLTLTGNLTVDLLRPLPDGSARPVTPFVVVGGGLFQSRQPTFGLPGQGSTTYNEGAFTAGGGVRARIGERVYVGGEARLGWESHLRVNGLVGVRLGR